MGRKSISGGVWALGSDRIQFDFEFDGVRYRPTMKRSPTAANLKRARKQLMEIRQRIAAGIFVFAEKFPDYRFIKNMAVPQKRRTCNQVFDDFLMACDSRVAKKDLAFVTAQGFRKLLAQIWRPEIESRIFDQIRYSELAKSRTPTNGRRKPITTRSVLFATPLTTGTGTTRKSTTRLRASRVCE